jgi:hypothetical protein
VEDRASAGRNLIAAMRAGVGTTASHRIKAINFAAGAFAAICIACLKDELKAGGVVWKLGVELFDGKLGLFHGSKHGRTLLDVKG